MVEFVRAGRTPEELAKKFEPSANAIRTWVTQADRDEGRRQDGFTTAEREEVRRLRRENRVLRERARDPAKSRGLVCQGDHVDPVQGFEFVKAIHVGRKRVARLMRAAQLKVSAAASSSSPPSGTRTPGRPPT
jgi:transposase